MTNWSNETVLTFLELYEEEAVIWNPSHSRHKDKNAVNDAWERISTALQKPVIVLKRKKESLMATYRLHLKKYKRSIASGADYEDVYRPTWFAYDVMDRFLKQVYEDEDVTLNQNQEDEHEQSPSIQLSRKRSFAIQRRRSSSVPEFHETCKQMRLAINRLHDVLDNKRVREEDECELFGKLISKKLRKFSDADREEIMYEIQGLLFDRSRRSPARSEDPNESKSTAD